MAAAGKPAPPGDREELLAEAGDGARQIFTTVRAGLDDLEAAAPWDQLYYPPEDTAAFVALGEGLAATVAGMPARIDELTRGLEEGGSGDETVGDVRFFFEGIHAMASAELDKLRGRLDAVDADDGALDPEERAEICEIAADLKGKYTSSIMGAAASLIAQDRWHGVAIEPVLFPEKAEEFARNRVLLTTLDEVLRAIAHLPEELPLPRLVETWRAGKRVDQYALTPLYAFLGTLGKLLKETTRRALYSGDHHQIRKREGALAARVNELNMLHNASWGTMPQPSGTDPAALHPTMATRATEIAAVLDVDLLRKTVGEATVKRLHTAVQLEGEKAKAGVAVDDAVRARTRKDLPGELHTLVALLHDEDLKTFLDLLIGSVRKRASLAYEAALLRTREAPSELPPELVELVAEEEKEADEEADDTGASRTAAREAGDAAARLLPDIDDFLDETGGWQPEVEDGERLVGDDERWAAPTSAPPAEVPAAEDASAAPAAPATEIAPAERAAAVETLHRTLATLLGKGNQERKAFDFLHRFVKQKRSIPPGMVQSVHPFLRSILQALLPSLEVLATSRDLPASAAEHLERSCRNLLDGKLSPRDMKHEVPKDMDRILHLLEGLQSTVAGLYEESAPSAAYWQSARAEDFSREF